MQGHHPFPIPRRSQLRELPGEPSIGAESAHPSTSRGRHQAPWSPVALPGRASLKVQASGLLPGTDLPPSEQDTRWEDSTSLCPEAPTDAPPFPPGPVPQARGRGQFCP